MKILALLLEEAAVDMVECGFEKQPPVVESATGRRPVTSALPLSLSFLFDSQ
jgi:hypothetical protein